MMRITKGLVFGVLGALLAGAVASAGFHTIEGSVDDSPMTIPVAREGDKVTYASFRDGNDTAHAVKGSTSVGIASDSQTRVESRPGPHMQGFVVEELTTMPDRTGMVHDVVLVVMTSSNDGEEDIGTLRQYVDLETRDVIRNDLYAEPEMPNGEMRLRIATFGPDNLTTLGFAGGEFFAYQGRTLLLGDDLTRSDIGLERVRIMESSGMVISSFSMTADRRAMVDGHDSYGISMYVRAKAPIDDHSVSGSLGPGGTSTMRSEARPGEVELEFKEVTWVSADVPYPIHIERSARLLHDGHEETEKGAISIAAYEPGNRTIPWGQDRAPMHYRERNEEAERTRSGYPTDGTGSSIEYPLSEAVASAQQDLALLQFQLWRQANPGHRLIGAHYSANEDNAGLTHLTWNLFFAVPGEGFAVQSERIVGVPTVRNSADGPAAAPSFDADDFPAEPITIAAAERLWAEVASERYSSEPPSALRWGVLDTAHNAERWGWIEIGHEASEGALGTFGFNSSILSVETATGNLMGYLEWALTSDQGFLVPPQAPARSAAIDAKRVPAGIQPPEIDEAALVSTSLLAVFLAVYFWPFAKYAGIQGLFFLPAYAKLRKDAILKNKVRGELLDAIRQDPGVHASELARRIDAGWGTLVYHLSVLEKNKYVTSLLDGRHKRFFPVGEIDWTKRGQVAALRHPRTRELFELIEEEPGIIQGALAKRADLSVPSAIWHLKRLEDAGLVGREKRGRKVHYFTNESPPAREPYDPDEAVEVA